MEENERGRSRGLPLDALEGRIEALVRREALRLSDAERSGLLSLIGDAERDGGDPSNTETLLLSWFTRHEVEQGTRREDAIRRAEAFVAYLLDVSAQGEARAFESLTTALTGA
jgi:hypothetical protein